MTTRRKPRKRRYANDSPFYQIDRDVIVQGSSAGIPPETMKSLKAMSKAIRDWRLNDLRRAMKEASNKAARPLANALVQEATFNNLYRTGKFIRSIKPMSSLTNPRVKIGTPTRVYYARIVAHKYPHRFPVKQTVLDEKPHIAKIFLEEQRKVAERFNRTVKRKGLQYAG